VCEVTVATNRNYKDRDGVVQEEATFVDVTFWGKTAEAVDRFFTQGRGMLVDGRLKLDSWEDKETGAKRSKLRVIGESFDFTDSKPKDGAANGSQQQQQQSRVASVDDDDEIPF
jgi:single-strand DNA-binding protein